LKAFVKQLNRKSFITKQELEKLYDALYISLLDGDVQVNVAKELVTSIKNELVGVNPYTTSSLNQRFLEYIESALVERLTVAFDPSLLPNAKTGKKFLFLVGLQGVGKTTTAAKLARLYKEQGMKVLLVAADLRRAKAIEQLQLLAKRADVECFAQYDKNSPIDLMASVKEIQAEYDLIIVDTSGRTTLSQELMDEIDAMLQVVGDDKLSFYVTDIYVARSALTIAKSFDQVANFYGAVITKADSDAKGGVLMNITLGLKKPILYISDSESDYALHKYSPERFAKQLLGGGNLETLFEQSARVIDKDTSVEDIINKGGFTFNDFVKYIKQMRKLGSIGGMLRYIPGANNLPDTDQVDLTVKRLVSMIDSMTPNEREHPSLVIAEKKRRMRIARGSGLSISEVDRQVSSFKKVNSLMEQIKTGDVSDLNSLMRLIQ
jgi:signal recognition particle subunit SRP54